MQNIEYYIKQELPKTTTNEKNERNNQTKN